jgi:hypothetical protein
MGGIGLKHTPKETFNCFERIKIGIRGYLEKRRIAQHWFKLILTLLEACSSLKVQCAS